MKKEKYDVIRKEIPDTTILFIRAGDFYEAYYENAIEIATLLSLPLHTRGEAPCIGIPYHAIDKYLEKLIMVFKKTIAMIEK